MTSSYLPAPIILPYKGIYPQIDATAFIAPGAVVIGNVTIGAESTVWFGCVVRGDVQSITIGDQTNIQDGTTIHVTRGDGPTSIGSGVTIGHQSLLHACMINDNAFIGMGAKMLDGSVVESFGMLAAGALLTPNKIVPTGQLWAGNPAKLFKELSEKDMEFFPQSAANYVLHGKEYRAELGLDT